MHDITRSMYYAGTDTISKTLFLQSIGLRLQGAMLWYSECKRTHNTHANVHIHTCTQEHADIHINMYSPNFHSVLICAYVCVCAWNVLVSVSVYVLCLCVYCMCAGLWFCVPGFARVLAKFARCGVGNTGSLSKRSTRSQIYCNNWCVLMLINTPHWSCIAYMYPSKHTGRIQKVSYSKERGQVVALDVNTGLHIYNAVGSKLVPAVDMGEFLSAYCPRKGIRARTWHTSSINYTYAHSFTHTYHNTST